MRKHPCYKRYKPDEARRLAKRLEIHYTPVYGSWLNIAEIEDRYPGKPEQGVGRVGTEAQCADQDRKLAFQIRGCTRKIEVALSKTQLIWVLDITIFIKQATHQTNRTQRTLTVPAEYC